jgi:hypothetical protein
MAPLYLRFIFFVIFQEAFSNFLSTDEDDDSALYIGKSILGKWAASNADKACGLRIKVMQMNARQESAKKLYSRHF